MLLTNLSGDENKRKGIALGAADYVIKSDFDPKQIVEKVLALSK